MSHVHLRPKTLSLVLKARERQNAIKVYQGEVLWAIASGMGITVPRYKDIIRPETIDSGTAEDTIKRLRERLKKVAKRR